MLLLYCILFWLSMSCLCGYDIMEYPIDHIRLIRLCSTDVSNGHMPVLASQPSDALFQVIQQLIGGNQLILGLMVIPTCQTSVKTFTALGCTPFSIGLTCSVGGFFNRWHRKNALHLVETIKSLTGLRSDRRKRTEASKRSSMLASQRKNKHTLQDVKH